MDDRIDAPLPDINRTFFKNQAIRLERKFAVKFENAGWKGGRNQVYGQYVQGYNELQKELNQKLTIINNRCIAYGFESLMEEEEPVEPVKMKY
tara:strand:- start:639 stop:917 length:279 start_codon:yes stop_codon:yes gene_type:complete